MKTYKIDDNHSFACPHCGVDLAVATQLKGDALIFADAFEQNSVYEAFALPDFFDAASKLFAVISRPREADALVKLVRAIKSGEIGYATNFDDWAKIEELGFSVNFKRFMRLYSQTGNIERHLPLLETLLTSEKN